MTLIKKIYLLLFIFLIHAPLMERAQSKGVDPLESLKITGAQIFGSSQQPNIKLVIGGVVQAIIGFVGIIFIVLIIMGGFQWMISGGNEQKVTAAKNRIIHATIGLTVILLAYAIAYTITQWLTGAIGAAGGGDTTGTVP